MNWDKPKVYAVRHKNENIREKSRSGGIFTAISDYVLNQDGIIYGCCLSHDFEAVHIRANNETERNKMRGSKYIQSKMGETFQNVKKDLETGKIVLFSGTSCQVAGLKKFLNDDYNNLICVDIVCHGVPSLKVWKSYIDWQQKRNRAKIKSVDFRNKKQFGWRAHIETINFDNGKHVNSFVFRNIFFGHKALRPSCYECHYKSIMHPADITIADYWGIEKAAPEFDDDKGVSLVLINNDKAEKIFNDLKEKLMWKETKIEDSMQPPLIEPFPKPIDRIEFWDDLNKKNFNYIATKYGGYGVKKRIKDLVRRFSL